MNSRNVIRAVDPAGWIHVGKGRRPAKSVRINVMLPEDLIAAIDRIATNRSRFLTEAAWNLVRH